MSLLKLDSTHPETFFDVLKQMNILEGTEIEVKQVKEGILIRPVTYQEQALKAALIHPFVSIEEQKIGFAKAVEEIKKLTIEESSQDLDSEWWIETIKNSAKPTEISMNDE
ncbi:MAG: AbrB/MazE/SpoVT family DNA-binding domain-containing protein [Acidobacteria bacterium]|nr:AbrB/MazE/SpoVT family DNA-binding domain-containing protein [Acidobacteriota bacterium]